jgi:hypothetical protein
VVPGWTGNHWIKWLDRVRAQEKEEPGFYMETGYRMPARPVEPGAAVEPEDTVPVTTLALRSVIGRPVDGAKVRSGPIEIVGVAIPGPAPIAAVEVSSDGGEHWRSTELEGERALGRWVVFRTTVDLARGRAEIVARATDVAGNVQPKDAAWNPSGYLWNGWHRVAIEAAS